MKYPKLPDYHKLLERLILEAQLKTEYGGLSHFPDPSDLSFRSPVS